MYMVSICYCMFTFATFVAIGTPGKVDVCTAREIIVFMVYQHLYLKSQCELQGDKTHSLSEQIQSPSLTG